MEDEHHRSTTATATAKAKTRRKADVVRAMVAAAKIQAPRMTKR
jgi:hypothetical protein